MGTFFVHSSVERILNHVQAFCQDAKHGFDPDTLAIIRLPTPSVPGKATHAVATAKAKLSAGKRSIGIRWHWAVESYRIGCFVRIRVRPSLWFQVGFLLRILGVLCSLAVCMLGGVQAVMREGIGNIFALLAGESPVFPSCYAAAFAGAFLGLRHAKWGRRTPLSLLQSEAGYWSAQRKESTSELVRPVRPALFSEWLDPLLLYGWVAPVLIAVSVFFPRPEGQVSCLAVLFALAGFTLAWAVLRGMAVTAMSDDPFASYRVRCMDIVLRWWQLHLHLVLLLCLLMTMSGILLVGVSDSSGAAVQGGERGILARLARASSLTQVTETCRDFDRLCGSQPSWRVAIAAIAESSSRSQGRGADLLAFGQEQINAPNDTYRRAQTSMRMYLRASDATACVLVFAFTVLLALQLGTFPRAVAAWSEEEGWDTPRRIALPPTEVRGRASRTFKWVVVWSEFLLGIVVNWLGTLISLDIIAYLITDRPLLFAVLRCPLAICRASLAGAFAVFECGVPRWTLLVPWVLLFLLALPTLLLTVRWTLTFLGAAVRGLRWARYGGSHPGMITQGIRDFTASAARRLRVRIPELRLTPHDSIRVHVSGWPLLPAKIDISRGALRLLEEDEMCAAIAHELAHTRRDVHMVAVAGWASRIALFPNRVLALAMDFTRAEFRADEASARLIGSPEPLIRCLAKVTVHGAVEARARERAAALLSLVGMKSDAASLGLEAGDTPPTISRGAAHWLSGLLRTIAGWPRRAWVRLVTNLVFLDEFYFGETLPGYAHPTLQLRIGRLREMSEQLPTAAERVVEACVTLS